MEKQIRKIKLIYSGELLLIAVAFLVIGFLELFQVIRIKDIIQLIFKIVTLVGATWLVIDFIWTLLSPKKRAKNCLMDKAMLLPLAVYLYLFDIYGLISERPYAYYQIGIPIVLFYIACAYIFQGIYHYYHPIPMVVQMIEEATKEVEEQQTREESSEKLLEEGDSEDNDEEEEENAEQSSGE